ncbi:DUF927 domain-containing protein [Providencia sp. PROV148]|uniref:DUF927 domain-containing protein n=1 Tax=Providencia sp. PROV148 TaxID=2949858 RepID=UPI00234A4606|nr:DUF927 domain-containing protein [Providencia sp. PROV148]
MSIEEHNQFAFDSVLQLAKEHEIAAEDAEIKNIETDYPRFKDIYDKEGETSGYIKTLADNEGRIHWLMAKSFHPGLAEVIWRSDGLSSMPEDQQKVKIDEYEKSRAAKDAAQEALRGENREALNEHIQTFPLAPNHHPYLLRKKVRAHGILINGNQLIIPLSEYQGGFITVQRIWPDGTKRFYKDCGKKGACYVIEGDSSTILITEGFATAASCYEATGYTSIMAIDCGNLAEVVKAVRSKTNVPIVIIADNDKYKERNAGVEAAEKAAKLYGCECFIPQFQDESTQPTDANDLAILEGVEELKRQLLPIIAHARMGIPSDYFFRNGWLYQKRVTDKGAYDVQICSALYPEALSRDKDNKEWGIVLKFADLDSHEHTFALPRAAIVKDPSLILEPLVSRGLQFNPNEPKALISFISNVQPVERARNVSQTGWYGEVFVLPNEAIGASSERVVYQSMHGVPAGYEQSGTLEEWQRNVAAYCRGNSRLSMMVAAAFAGSLLELDHALESGGFHIRSESSRGKTTALRLCKSVWGSADKLVTWRATSNGLESVAYAHNDSTLVIDELGQMADENPSEAAQTVYMVANGSSKQRANRSGGAASLKTWRLIFVSAGEVSLSNLMSQAGKMVKAGQEVRFIDIPADAGKGLGIFEELHGFSDAASFAEMLNSNSKQYYGAASRAFLLELAGNKPAYAIRLKELMAKFLQYVPEGADGQIKRAANRFALVAASGELAINITGWEEGEAFRGVKACFDAWLLERGDGSHESNQALEAVKSQLLKWGDSRFGQNTNAPVWGYKDGNDFYVYPESFKNDICQGLDHRNVAQLLFKMGFLPKTTAVSKRINCEEVRRVYPISGKILESSQPEEPTPYIVQRKILGQSNSEEEDLERYIV